LEEDGFLNLRASRRGLMRAEKGQVKEVGLGWSKLNRKLSKGV